MFGIFWLTLNKLRTVALKLQFRGNSVVFFFFFIGQGWAGIIFEVLEDLPCDCIDCFVKKTTYILL